MDFKLREEQIALERKQRFAMLKTDLSVDDTIEENLDKQYRIKPLVEDAILFYHDKKKDRALIVKIELHHLMNREIFTKCLSKKWDTGKKTTKKQREKITKRIENYYTKYFNKTIFE